MSFESVTDEKIAELMNCSKRCVNPNSRVKNKNGHEQVNYKVVASDGTDRVFEIYSRQNIREGMEDSFSCGISWIAPSGESLTLRRYNGPGHEHANQLEKDSLGLNSHIHIATERYIKANKKAEGYAEVTDRYTTVEGALHCLVKDFNITGIQTTPENRSQTKLF